jgi:putative redox protein
MIGTDAKIGARTIDVVYDGSQHCTAHVEPQGKAFAMDCPYTSKGEEFSPTNVIGTALAGCMLMSMGTLAMRDKLDLTGTRVVVDITMTEKPVTRIGAIDVEFHMPQDFSAVDRVKLERAAGLCPLKPSFHPDIPITVQYIYPT